jgi:peptidoglycan/LPS O-acetylase OafA/YrhL
VDALPAVLLLTGLTVVIGSILYATVEMPFMRLRDRYFPSNAGWPAAVALMGSPR